MTNSNPKLGFIGLGTMGSQMAQNLLKAGYTLTVFDLSEKALATVSNAGAIAASDADTVIQQSDIVLTSLPSSSVFVQVAETSLLPHAKSGQLFIDLGTTEGSEIRRLATEFAEKGAALLDAPVSGGGSGAEAGTLRIFVGGDEAIFTQCRPILDVLGEPDRVVYCGPSGSGQAVKGANQLAMGLGAAAYLEALAYGVRGGADADAIAQAVGGPSGWRQELERIAQRVVEETAEGVLVKFPELPYFLDEATAQAFDLPLTEALFSFLDSESRDWVDNMNRPTVSFWHHLMKS